MEHLLTNVSAVGIRTVQERGRTYLVAPLSLIVPGVLSGSKGPLYYPPEEIAANVDAWNGTPMVVYHPYVDGTPISAKDHPHGEKIVIGTVRNSRIDKQRLVAEGWFDIQATKRVDSRVLDSLNRGTKIELSTGLYTDNVPVKNGVDPKGRSYAYIAKNYRPDHLAILPDQKGACSLEDGCGVLVNKETTQNCGGKGGKPGPCPVHGKTVGGMKHIQSTSSIGGLKTAEIADTVKKMKVGDSVHVVYTEKTRDGSQGKSMTGKVTGFGTVTGTQHRAAVIDATGGDMGTGKKIISPLSSIHAISYGVGSLPPATKKPTFKDISEGEKFEQGLAKAGFKTYKLGQARPTGNAWSPQALAAALKSRLAKAGRKVKKTAGWFGKDIKEKATAVGQKLGLVKPTAKVRPVAKAKTVAPGKKPSAKVQRAKPASSTRPSSSPTKGGTIKLGKVSAPDKSKSRAAALLRTTERARPASSSSGKKSTAKATPKAKTFGPKTTISQAAKELKKKGFELGKGHTDLKTKQTSYEVTHTKTGKTARVSASSIKDLLNGKQPTQVHRASSTLSGRDSGTRATGKSTSGYVKSKDRWYKKLASKKPTRNTLLTNQESDMANRVLNCGGKGGTPGPCKGKSGSGSGSGPAKLKPKQLSPVQISKRTNKMRKLVWKKSKDQMRIDQHLSDPLNKFTDSAALGRMGNAKRANQLYREGVSSFRKALGLTKNEFIQFVTNEQGDNSVKKLTANQRTTIADRLITNGCGCWEEADREVLNAFDDTKLRSLYKGMKRHNELEELATTVNTLLAETEEDMEQGMALNAMPAALMKAIAKKKGGDKEDAADEPDDEESEDEMPMKGKKPVKNGKGCKPTSNAGLNEEGDDVKNATASRLTPAEQATLNWANSEIDRQKTELVTKLTANVGKDQKEAMTKTLNAKSLDDLKLMVSLMPAPVEKTEDNRRPSYFGAAAPVGNMSAEQAEKDKEDFLPLPTINWAEVSKSNAN